MVEHNVPRSILSASRTEISEPEELHFVEGYKCEDLPEDLQGHVFIVAPVGSVEFGSGKDIYKRINERNKTDDSGNTFMNGDGMIYRLDFNEEGKVKWMQKIANPPDYEVDKEIKESEGFKYRELLKFRDLGLMRFSPLLGLRNQLNTAFMPIQFQNEKCENEPDRLLVTYDAGFPYEINTNTLEVKEPVIGRNEWRPEFDQPEYPFPVNLSTAHPVFDRNTKER